MSTKFEMQQLDCILPGEEEWTTHGRKPRVVCLPSKLFRCHLFSVPGGTDEALDGQLVSLELERLGLAPRHPQGGFSFEAYRGEDGSRVLSSVILQADDVPEGCHVEGLSRFEPHALCRHVPKGAAVIWRELGDFVLGASAGSGAASYFQVLSSRQLDEEAGEEIEMILRSLEMKGLPVPRTLLLSHSDPEASSGFVSRLESRFGLGLQVRISPDPGPRTPLGESSLVPANVLARKEERSRQHSMLRLVAMIVALGVAVLALNSFLLFRKAKALEDRRAALLVDADLAAQIAAAQSQSDALEDSFEPEQFAIATLNRVMSTLPPSGVTLKEMSFDPGRVEFSGETVNVDRASEIGVNIKRIFPELAWTFPPPRILDNGRAEFNAVGLRAGEEGGAR